MNEERFVPMLLLQFARSRDRPTAHNHLNYITNPALLKLNRAIENLEEWIMPSKSSRNAAPKPWANTTFVDIRLSSPQKDEFVTFMTRKDADLSLALADFIADGNKTSLTWDDENKTFIAASTCKNPDSPNVDCCISSRSQDWYEALMLNVFKHIVVCNSGEWRSEQTERNWG